MQHSISTICNPIELVIRFYLVINRRTAGHRDRNREHAVHVDTFGLRRFRPHLTST